MQFQRSHVKLKTRTLGWPRALRWRGSVLPRVMLPTVILAAWATIVVLWQGSPGAVFFPSGTTFLTITSFVLSLLLGFRTNTAYERYWEGRRIWSNLSVATRNLARLIWIAADEPAGRDSRAEKMSAFGIILTFLISVRNHARHNAGLVTDDGTGTLRPEFVGLLPPRARISGARPYLITAPQYAHADALYLLNAYVDDLLRRKTLDLPQTGQILNLLNSMNDSFTSIERILTTPIPLAYSLHLKQIMYMVLFLLPFQLYADFKFLAILVTALATFTFVGVELIGSEIENPFGVDENDLRVEEFIADLEVELGELSCVGRSDLADWALEDDDNTSIHMPTKPRNYTTYDALSQPMPTADVPGDHQHPHLGFSTVLGMVAIGNRVVHSGSIKAESVAVGRPVLDVGDSEAPAAAAGGAGAAAAGGDE